MTTPGVPALILFVVCVAVALLIFTPERVVPLIHHWRHEEARLASMRSGGIGVHKETPPLLEACDDANVLAHSARVAFVAFPFFIWACFHVVMTRFDLGSHSLLFLPLRHGHIPE